MGEKTEHTRVINQHIGSKLEDALRLLQVQLEGDVFTDLSVRLMYSTDASAYRELPLAVCRPSNEQDIVTTVKFASEHNLTIIPRAAGTSLAGQVVGRGLVLDISRYMTKVIELNTDEKWIKVQPGVILDEMNKALITKNLFFSPETSTSNRCMIGGMIGNNSAGLHSLVYGSTREHLISVRMVLSDGTIAEFGELDVNGFNEKCALKNLEGALYRNIRDILQDPGNVKSILDEYPDPEVVRRNTGYALDELAQSTIFNPEGKYKTFNFCRLIAGSEGTLGIITAAILALDPLPPPVKALVPVHMDSVMAAIRGNLIALRHGPTAVELMDKAILDLTKKNISQNKNRFFVKGDPGAILIVEFAANTIDEITDRAEAMEKEMIRAGLGFHFPLVTGDDIPRVWNLRKAGLGVLSRRKGDAKSVSVIEDTSVTPSRLEDYISEFNKLLEKYNLECVYHAHISVGELHLRPLLNLKSSQDVEIFHEIARESAQLVKKYRGSLSGEHGDGRLRAEFIPMMIGEKNFSLMRSIKHTWDPGNIFNKGKIIDSPPMNSSLRYEPGYQTPDIDTVYDFSPDGGIIRHVEQCNGSGDCRKTELTGGTMCPSYMASKEEWTTTRARANILREFIGSNSKRNAFDHKEIYEVLDLCLSCKACKSECPSSVDMAKLKSEFLQHWYDAHGVPLRSRIIANISSINRIGTYIPGLFNFLTGNKIFSGVLKSFTGIAPERSFPRVSGNTVYRWAKKELDALNGILPDDSPEVTFFVDEFTDQTEPEIGITAIKLLNNLGIKVLIFRSAESGRAQMSKGFARKAQKIARRNVSLFRGIITDDRPLIGTEPSAILSFRDEYPDLVGDFMQQDAKELAENCLLFEEYIARLNESGKIDRSLFTNKRAEIKVHGHCQQKAISSSAPTISMLSIPENYNVSEIPSGCCGMAGSFGYEKEHFDLSMKVGELVLFPEIRNSSQETIFAVPGTSCRHQVKDGTGKTASHPVQIMYNALKIKE